MATDISKLGLKAKWQDLTEGMVIAGSGTSKDFMTGEWTHVKPEFIADKCKQCLLCSTGLSGQLHSDQGYETWRI